MESQHFDNRTGWIIILYGLGLSFFAAFTPFFDAGYLFKGNVLLAGLLPYMIYAIAVPLLPGTSTTSVGITLALAHTGLVVSVRFFSGSENLMFILPIMMAVLLLPLVAIALIKTDVHKPEPGIIGHEKNSRI